MEPVCRGTKKAKGVSTCQNTAIVLPDHNSRDRQEFRVF